MPLSPPPVAAVSDATCSLAGVRSIPLSLAAILTGVGLSATLITGSWTLASRATISEVADRKMYILKEPFAKEKEKYELCDNTLTPIGHL